MKILLKNNFISIIYKLFLLEGVVLRSFTVIAIILVSFFPMLR